MIRLSEALRETLYSVIRELQEQYDASFDECPTDRAKRDRLAQQIRSLEDAIGEMDQL